MPEQTYKVQYDAFLTSYKAGSTTGEQVGEQIAKMAQWFASQNTILSIATITYAKTTAEFEQRVDENGKQLSSTKAGKLAEATQEASEYVTAKMHVQNVEQIINALKSLQKGVLQEYSHLGGQ